MYILCIIPCDTTSDVDGKCTVVSTTEKKSQVNAEQLNKVFNVFDYANYQFGDTPL